MKEKECFADSTVDRLSTQVDASVDELNEVRMIIYNILQPKNLDL